MFFENAKLRGIIKDIVLDPAFRTLSIDALLIRFPLLKKWEKAIPKKQTKKTINHVSREFTKKYLKGCTIVVNGEVQKGGKLHLCLEYEEIRKGDISLEHFIKLLNDAINAVANSIR